MRPLEEVTAELRAMLPELRARWPIARLGVFGSYVRGEQGQDSDLDLLVDLDRPVSLFTFLEMEERDRPAARSARRDGRASGAEALYRRQHPAGTRAGMRRRDARAYVADMLQACEDIGEMVSGVRPDAFAADRMRLKAVIRDLEVLGAACPPSCARSPARSLGPRSWRCATS